MNEALALVMSHLPDQRFLDGWEVVPYLQDGVLVAAAVVKGTEFHCATTPAFRFRREPLREFLRPLFERHGYLTTRLEVGDTANERFNRVFGFKRSWGDGRFNYFIMAELPFKLEATCLSSHS